MTPEQIDWATQLLAEDLRLLGYPDAFFVITDHDDGSALDIWINDLLIAWVWTIDDVLHLHARWQPVPPPDSSGRCRDCGMPIGVNYPAGRCPEHFTKLLADNWVPLCTKVPGEDAQVLPATPGVDRDIRQPLDG